jgi:hypothetical protein
VNNATIELINLGILVHRYNIIGTRLWMYAAYEPTSLAGKHHSSISSFDQHPHAEGIWYGTVTSAPLPEKIDRLPGMTQERYRAYDCWHKDRCAIAYNAIIQAFPEAADGLRGEGRIQLQVSQ